MKGPLAYVLREKVEVPDVSEDPLLLNEYYGMMVVCRVSL